MRGLSQTLRHVALAALILRAMLPAGWMPDAHGLTICSATLGAVHHDSAPGHDKASHEECPFAATQMAAAPETPRITLPVFHAFIASMDRARAAAIAARFTPQSPRAPPLNA
ncbi:MAG TPA: hypothetical protein VG821_05280 [Rhizomicrobium sp.]|jgi:hypothetical protein|nr:hypothetical protein [Rhizomicrobium sp.]